MDLESVFVGLIGVLVGAIIGHWLSIGRDRRTEFNAASGPIYKELESQRLLAKQGLFPAQGELLTHDGLIIFKQHLSKRKRNKFESDFYRYLEARAASISQHDFIQDFHSPELLVLAIEKMQDYCVRK